MNLPTEIQFSNNRKIQYTYDASGIKVQKKITNTTGNTITTDYRNGFQYKQNKLQFFPTAEGYVRAVYCNNCVTQLSYQYVYNYTDHLGNIRLSYTQTETGLKVLEENHYYPFGLKHDSYNQSKKKLTAKMENSIKKIQAVSRTASDSYNYKYQGQERQDEFDLNWDSFKYRNYDYAIGRFMSIDPLAEKYTYNSTYAFQENKMGLGRELEGLEMVPERSEDGKSLTITYKVAPNNKNNTLTNAQFRTLVEKRKALTEKVLSGNATHNRSITVNIVEDKNATIKWDYVDAITEVDGSPGLYNGLGYTDENGNTNKNRTQVNIGAIFKMSEKGDVIFDEKSVDEATKTGSHEDGHVAGLEHKGYSTKKVRSEMKSNNLMIKDGNGTDIKPIQRREIWKNVIKKETIK